MGLAEKVKLHEQDLWELCRPLSPNICGGLCMVVSTIMTHTVELSAGCIETDCNTQQRKWLCCKIDNNNE